MRSLERAASSRRPVAPGRLRRSRPELARLLHERQQHPNLQSRWNRQSAKRLVMCAVRWRVTTPRSSSVLGATQFSTARRYGALWSASAMLTRSLLTKGRPVPGLHGLDSMRVPARPHALHPLNHRPAKRWRGRSTSKCASTRWKGKLWRGADQRRDRLTREALLPQTSLTVQTVRREDMKRRRSPRR